MIKIQYKRALDIIRNYAYITDLKYQFKPVTIPGAIKMLKSGDQLLLKTGAKLLRTDEGYFLSGYAQDKSDLIIN